MSYLIIIYGLDSSYVNQRHMEVNVKQQSKYSWLAIEICYSLNGTYQSNKTMIFINGLNQTYKCNHWINVKSDREDTHQISSIHQKVGF